MANRAQTRAAARREPTSKATSSKPRRAAEEVAYRWSAALLCYVPADFPEVFGALLDTHTNHEIALFVQKAYEEWAGWAPHSIEECVAYVWELDMKRFWSALRDAVVRLNGQGTEMNFEGVVDALSVHASWLHSVILDERVTQVLRPRARALKASSAFRTECDEWVTAFLRWPGLEVAQEEMRARQVEKDKLHESLFGVDPEEAKRRAFAERYERWAHGGGGSPWEPDTTSTETPTLTK